MARVKDLKSCPSWRAGWLLLRPVLLVSSSLSLHLLRHLQKYGAWMKLIGITALPYQKRDPSALKGLQEGGNILDHKSEPIVLNHYCREQVFRKQIERGRLYKNALQLLKDSPHAFTVRHPLRAI